MDDDSHAKLDQIVGILGSAGDGLMRSDLRRIKALLASLPEDVRFAVEPSIFGGMWRTWAFPTYTGDIKRL